MDNPSFLYIGYLMSSDHMSNEYIKGIMNILESVNSTQDLNLTLLENLLASYRWQNTIFYIFGVNQRYKFLINNSIYYLENVKEFAKAIKNLKMVFPENYSVYGYNNTFFCIKPGDTGLVQNLTPICKLSEVPVDLLTRTNETLEVFHTYK